LDHVSDESLHAEVKTLAGRHNVLTADLLAHLAEVEARGIHRERACSSLYAYCLYELRFSEDEAQRRARAARAAREFPVLFEMLADGAIHLTGLLLLAPYLTRSNHGELLARARFRTKREIERLIAEVAPRPDVPARVEPLGPRPATRVCSWQTFTASLRGPVRELRSGVGHGDAPPAVFDDAISGASDGALAVPSGALGESRPGPSEVANDGECEGSCAPARVNAEETAFDSIARVPLRYRVEFTASEAYVELLEEARNLLQHQVPTRDIAKVHELAMAAFVEMLRKRRKGGPAYSRACKSERPGPAQKKTIDERSAPERMIDTKICPSRPGAASIGSAPEWMTRLSASRGVRTSGKAATTERARASTARNRHVPAAERCAIWQRDEGRCTFTDDKGRRCEEQAGLEIHHEHPFARGGPTTVENLRLMCRAHNALFAERDFGREFVERRKWGER
jgi:hypothetical protein